MKGNETVGALLVRGYASKAPTPPERCSAVFPAPPPLFPFQFIPLRRDDDAATKGNETVGAACLTSFTTLSGGGLYMYANIAAAQTAIATSNWMVCFIASCTFIGT